MAAFDEGPILPREGDIVQVTDEFHVLYRALVIVAGRQTWGIDGGLLVPLPRHSGMTVERVYIEHGKYKKVGRAAIAVRDTELLAGPL